MRAVKGAKRNEQYAIKNRQLKPKPIGDLPRAQREGRGRRAGDGDST